jgi:hypothetical protein
VWLKHLIGSLLSLLIIAGWGIFYRPNLHPSDESLIGNFQQHQGDFNWLARLTEEDASVAALNPDYVRFNDDKIWPESCDQRFSWERWMQYKDLLLRLGEYNMERFLKQSGILYLPASTVASDLNEDAEYIVIIKGYAYSPREPWPLVDSLDGMGFDHRGTFYKKIDDHWYLYHERIVAKPE